MVTGGVNYVLFSFKLVGDYDVGVYICRLWWGWWVFYFVFLYIVGFFNVILIFVYIILMYIEE